METGHFVRLKLYTREWKLDVFIAEIYFGERQLKSYTFEWKVDIFAIKRIYLREEAGYFIADIS